MEDSKVRPADTIKFSPIRVEVRPADTKDAQMIQLDKALKVFKKKLEKDGVLFEAKERRFYDKPSVIERARKKKLKGKKI